MPPQSAAVLSRREKVALLLAKGVESPTQISLRLGMDGNYASRQVIQNDIRCIMDTWRESLLDNADCYANMELTHLLYLKREAHDIIDRAKRDREIQESKTKISGYERTEDGAEDLAKPIVSGREQKKKVEARDGSIAAIREARAISDQICKLRGLYPDVPAKVQEYICQLEDKLALYEDSERQRQIQKAEETRRAALLAAIEHEQQREAIENGGGQVEEGQPVAGSETGEGASEAPPEAQAG